MGVRFNYENIKCGKNDMKASICVNIIRIWYHYIAICITSPTVHTIFTTLSRGISYTT